MHRKWSCSGRKSLLEMDMIDVIVALEAELAGRRLPSGYRVTFCGVGKINAALAAAAVLAREDCRQLVNFGIA